MSEQIGATQAVSTLLKAENVLVLCHKNPDGDTIGSAAALCLALQGFGKTTAMLCADPIPARYDYLPLPMFANQFTPGYVVAVDVAGSQLFGDGAKPYCEHVDLCIDHHSANSGYAGLLLLDDAAAATAEIIYELLVTMNTPLTQDIANALYTGLSTDTGCFKFGNTTARTHAIAAKLIEAGADITRLNYLLFECKSRSRLALEREALSTMEFYFEDTCAVICLSREQIASAGADVCDLEGLAALPRAIEGVDVGVTMRQQPGGSYKVSVRTGESVNAAEICKRLGGGGHKRAAGCEILGSLENAKGALLAEVQREICRESL